MNQETSQPTGGASVRYGDPWAAPLEARDPVRRLRGHLVLPVTVWTAGTVEGAEVGEGAQVGEGAGGAGATEPGLEKMPPVGLTVSSVVLSQGAPPMLAGLISPASDFADVLTASASGRFVVQLLGSGHRRLAQHFAGELPAPEELLLTRPSPHGPLLEKVPDRLFCRMTDSKPFGWSLLVEAEVEGTEVGDPAGKGLAWYRGGFQVLDA
jgi:3-hydroxy-9,10-secoandrosta-1,3,5(10)-triene-9,17-dione monooxygenase reductase component